MFGPFFHDDDAWDEERWEAFLREHDRRVDRYMSLFLRFTAKHPRPDADDVAAINEWKDGLRNFLREKGWRRDDLFLPFFLLDDEPDDDDTAPEAAEPFFDDAFFDDALDEPDEDPFASLDALPVYRHANALTDDVLDWAHGLAGDVKTLTLVHFCSHVMQIPAHLARGHGIGLDRDGLGGNIACVKRALADANAALDLLRQLKAAPFMDAATYRRLVERAFELRNALGLYVQHLRERFDLGID